MNQPETTLEDLVKIIDSCENEGKAFEVISKATGVSFETAKKFREKYDPLRHLSQKEAFHLFYLDIKDGLI